RIEWREFPYLGEPADTLSIGALAAGEQDSFWEYQEVVFDSQDDLTSASQPEEELMGIVDDLGLDTDRFAEDLEDQELAEKVDADFSQGMQIGVSGTPAFIINGDPVMGAQPLDVFVNSIDLALAAAEG
ncbi:MAG TPA: DsbA family protein, partial [Candidatus Nocardiopsis merdipullorum]|nr:DsbA family protein [Candidatus Nocardiopsis merdipullorum]